LSSSSGCRRSPLRSSAVAKLPQIIKAFQDKSTGQLDLFMVTLQTLGSLTRVFTTLQSVNNPIYLFGYVLGSSLNAIMTAQVLYLRQRQVAETSAKTETKVAESKETRVNLTSGANHIH
jgi:mannose-P-dolichol utilization defect protein 1